MVQAPNVALMYLRILSFRKACLPQEESNMGAICRDGIHTLSSYKHIQSICPSLIIMGCSCPDYLQDTIKYFKVFDFLVAFPCAFLKEGILRNTDGKFVFYIKKCTSFITENPKDSECVIHCQNRTTQFLQFSLNSPDCHLPTVPH